MFFSRHGDRHVYAGIVQYLSDDRTKLTVHEYRQANKQQTRFSPLYTDTQRHKVVVSMTPKNHHVAVSHDVESSQIVLTGVLSDTYHIDPSLLDLLQAAQ